MSPNLSVVIHRWHSESGVSEGEGEGAGGGGHFVDGGDFGLESGSGGWVFELGEGEAVYYFACNVTMSVRC